MSEYVRAYEGNEPYLFVSYAHIDREMVLPVIQALYEKKYRVWYDEGIAPGSEWPQNIARHLQKASLFLAFVSKNFLASPNCENEVRLATGQKKDVIAVCLDGFSRHPLLAHADSLDFDENLITRLTGNSCLSSDFIGDGMTGYQYAIDKKRSFNFWNLMLGFAAVLALAFAATLYGLYTGRFDDLLPAKRPVLETVSPTPQPEETISIGGNIIGSVLPVEFPSVEEKNAVYQKLGWNQFYEMTYKDLVEMTGLTQLDISNEPITDITFAAYLPNLEVITLSRSQITDLTPLIECPKLKKVQVTADMLPMTIPTTRRFEVEVS